MLSRQISKPRDSCDSINFKMSHMSRSWEAFSSKPSELGQILFGLLTSLKLFLKKWQYDIFSCFLGEKLRLHFQRWHSTPTFCLLSWRLRCPSWPEEFSRPLQWLVFSGPTSPADRQDWPPTKMTGLCPHYGPSETSGAATDCGGWNSKTKMNFDCHQFFKCFL